MVKSHFHARFITLCLTVLLCGYLLCGIAQAQTLTISGDVATPLTVTAADFAGLPRTTVSRRSEDGTNVTYEGVLVSDVLKKAGAPSGKQLRGKALSSYVLAVAKDGYEVTFSLAELDPDFSSSKFIIADKRDGKPLFDYQGPYRIVAESDKPEARCIRMLEKLEVVRLKK